MPKSNRRIAVMLEPPLFAVVRKLAKLEGVSLSAKARDLIRNALVEYEDVEFVRLAEERAKSFNRRKALTHEHLWE